MAQPIKLPDYLPSRYQSWLHLYVAVLNAAKEHGLELKEDQTIKIGDVVRPEELSSRNNKDETLFFEHEWPLQLIKSRALDVVMAFLPDYRTCLEIGGRCHYASPGSEKISQALNDLLYLTRITGRP